MQHGYDSVSKRIWADWPDVLPEINDQFIAEGEEFLASTGHGGNPLGGSLDNFPIVACLTAQLDLRIKGKRPVNPIFHIQ